MLQQTTLACSAKLAVHHQFFNTRASSARKASSMLLMAHGIAPSALKANTADLVLPSAIPAPQAIFHPWTKDTVKTAALESTQGRMHGHAQTALKANTIQDRGVTSVWIVRFL